MKFTPPITVHFLIHESYDKLHEVRKFLYSLLCRDSNNTNFDGLDIPVYFHIGSSNNIIPEICEVESEKRIIIPLIDEYMFCDDVWRGYIKNLIRGGELHILPVSLCEYAFEFNEDLGKNQFITLKSQSILDNRIEFQTRLFEFILRILSGNEKEKLILFISHSKKDKDQIGRIRAEELRDYLGTHSKLDSFFDANDIPDGQDFGDIINENVSKSLFVLIHSDTYSDREWCRKEILECKYKQVPAIRVELFSKGCSRLFPYMANIPCIRFSDNWEEIVALMLRTALDWRYQKAYLEKLNVACGDMHFGIEPTIPELISVHHNHKAEVSILYPEPPVGIEELEVLNDSFENKTFVTPMQLMTKGKNLTGRKIAISISEPTDSTDNVLGQEMLNDLAIELPRHLLASKAELVYGGDLRQNGFTRKLAELSYQYAKSEHSKGEYYSFHNFFAWPISNTINHIERLFLTRNRVKEYIIDAPSGCTEEEKSKFIPPYGSHYKLLWSISLTKMREEMENFADALIVMGGRTQGFKGKMPGIIQEVKIALSLKRPVYIVGSSGGCASILQKCILKSTSFDVASKMYNIDDDLKITLQSSREDTEGYSFLSDLHKAGIRQLNNGLGEEDNIRLLSSTNVTEIVALILQGLTTKLNEHNNGNS